MNKRWDFILGLVFMLLICSVFSANAEKIADLSILDSFITVGESFEVSVYVSDDGTIGDLTVFGFDVDPLDDLSFLSFDGYSMGDGFDDFSFGPKNVSGVWDPFSLIMQPNKILLANLKFTALGVGSDTLTIEGLYDGFNGLTYTATTDDIFGTKSITVNAPVPEPTTIVLLGLGILIIGTQKRRK